MQQRLEDINRSLLTGEYARRPPSSRSPSPPPQYDSFGKRTNTREIRRRSKLETERAELVERMRRNNPRWRPPPGLSGGGRRNYVTKVYFPVDEYPDFNFLGHVIGPRGSSLKQLEARTKARVQIRGRGSEKDGKRVLSQGSTEKLHAVITASTEEAMHAAKAEIEKLCNVVPEEENEHKRQQLMLLSSNMCGQWSMRRPAPASVPSRAYKPHWMLRCGLCTMRRMWRRRQMPLRAPSPQSRRSSSTPLSRMSRLARSALQ